MNRDGLKRLGDIAEILAETSRARLADNARAQAACVRRVDEINADRCQRYREVTALSEPDAAQLSGIDVRWQRWGDQEIATARRRQAQLLARREALQVEAARALGRAMAIEKMQEKLAAQARLERARKAAES